VGVAVPGTPNPADATFRADQQGLYDSRQFNDPTLYPVGYHWKIDRGIGPHGVREAHASFDRSSNQWVIDIAFTPAAAQRFGADTEAAFQAMQAAGSNPSTAPALAHVAFFIGNQVVSAPYVQRPSSNDTQVQGNFTEQQADDLARAIMASAQST
jgi:preprotein translocase subunit SecD